MDILGYFLSTIIHYIVSIPFDFFKIFNLLLIILLTWLIHYFFIKPYLLQKYYISQGFISSTQFNLVLSNKDSIQHEDDSMGYLRDIVNKIPDIKGFIFKLGPKVMLAIIDSKLLGEISQSVHLVKFNPYLIREFNKDSLIRMEGEKHKQIRRILTSVFNFDYIISNIEVMTQLSIEKFKEWEDKNWINNEYIDIMDESGNFTGGVVGALFFGISHNKDMIKGKRVTDVIASLILRFLVNANHSMQKPWISLQYKFGLTKEFRELKQDMDAFKLYALEILKNKKAQITQAQQNNTTESLLTTRDLTSVLLKAQLNSKNPEEKLTDDEIIAQYILFFAAGQDTTSHLITICIYLLTQYTIYAKDIRQEIKNNIPDLNHIPYKQTTNLVLLNGFIKEALRLYPPATQIVTRIASNDFALDKQYHIKKGTLVTAFLLANSWKTDNFTEPREFKPERWIENGEGNKFKDPFVYIPFWAGQRNCLGQHLAIMETKIFLIQLLMRYSELELDPSYKLKMTNRNMYEPYDNVKIRFKKA